MLVSSLEGYTYHRSFFSHVGSNERLEDKRGFEMLLSWYKHAGTPKICVDHCDVGVESDHIGRSFDARFDAIPSVCRIGRLGYAITKVRVVCGDMY